MQVTTIGFDLCKNVFQVHGVAESGAVVMRERLRRARVLAFFADQQLQRLAQDGETVTPSLPEPDMWTGRALAHALGASRWKRAKSIEASGNITPSRISKPDIRQQL